MKNQSQGIYTSDPSDFVFNWISHKLEIRQTESKGRGVFLKEPVKKGELLFVEKAIEGVSDLNNTFTTALNTETNIM